VTVFRWVQRFTPLLADAARPCRHAVGDRWYVDETYVKVAGRWRYVYRAIDQYGQIIDVYLSARRDTRAARRPVAAKAVRRSVRRPAQRAATIAQRIVDHLATVESAGAHELAKATKATRESVGATLSYLNSRGRIRRVSRGRYARRR
jgi:IS6 family transposase